jgi:hypothetical protein
MKARNNKSFLCHFARLEAALKFIPKEKEEFPFKTISPCLIYARYGTFVLLLLVPSNKNHLNTSIIGR